MPEPTPLLVIAGIQVFPQVGGATRRQPIVPGEVTRSFSGRLLSTVRAGYSKQEWEFTLAPMTVEASAEFRAAIEETAFVAVGGRFISDVTLNAIDALVTVTGVEPVRTARGEYQEVLTITVQEA